MVASVRIATASAKSAMRGSLPRSNRMLRGLISRCTTPCSCAWCKLHAHFAAIAMAFGMATSRLSMVFRARYTAPHSPCPIGRINRHGPSCSSGTSFINVANSATVTRILRRDETNMGLSQFRSFGICIHCNAVFVFVFARCSFGRYGGLS
ncbi:MAG: hypothetical protein ACI9W2_001895, partial [Gammaproteobacteria bacterium]